MSATPASVAATRAYDAAVIGAGVAGSALAYALACDGRKVALFGSYLL